jgi:flagellar basal-body rod modification protein FlgD|tara:strand:- start:403 stop:1089 length:687 start_codon:yes stop_codon:yes gene_type:complete
MALDIAGSTLPAGITSYENYVNTPKQVDDEMGQQQFLQLFTAQLQNQNPLEPVKNEAFVAQLAQFSSLEANLSMKGSLDTMVTSQAADRVMASAALIGKSVAVPGGAVNISAGEGGDGVVNLPYGSAGMKVNVLNSSGVSVRELIYPSQAAGDFALKWNGRDANGETVPNGAYTFSATAVVQGATTPVDVNALAKVTAVSTSAVDKSLILEFEGGKTMPLADVTRIGV